MVGIDFMIFWMIYHPKIGQMHTLGAEDMGRLLPMQRSLSTIGLWKHVISPLLVWLIGLGFSKQLNSQTGGRSQRSGVVRFVQ